MGTRDKNHKGEQGNIVTDCIHLTLPFFILRNFLDVIFGVILSYGFLTIAEEIYSIRTHIKDITYSDNGNLLQSGLNSLSTMCGSGDFIAECSTLLILFTILVMLIDDISRSKILTYLSPCRSIDRFGVDIIIPFFWGLSFFFAKEKSSLFFSSLGLTFLLGSIWAHKVSHESRDWQILQENCEEVYRKHECPAQISDKVGWNLYQKRLTYILRSHLFAAFLLFALNFWIMIYDINKKYWTYYSIFLIIFYWLLETIRFSAECGFIRETNIDKLGDSYPGILKTIVWIPSVIQKALGKDKEEI